MLRLKPQKKGETRQKMLTRHVQHKLFLLRAVHHCFCYIGNSYCNICRFLFDYFKLCQKLINYWYRLNILICISQSVLANEVNFLYGFQKSNAMLLLEAISLARCTQ